MMRYSVWTKRQDKPRRRWKLLSDSVVGDGLLEIGTHRWFLLEDKTRIEVPLTHFFKFCPKRFESEHNKMETTAGQTIPLRK